MPAAISSYWELVEPVFDAVDISSPDRFLASAAAMPRPVLLLYAAHFCLSEIHNGGYLQFFWNSTGVIAPEAIEGFNSIGMQMLASVTAEAAGRLGSPYIRDRDERWDALLMASGLDEQALKDIFENAPNLYLAFEEATKGLDFAALNRQAWALAKTENGGFQNAATRYARGIASNEQIGSAE